MATRSESEGTLRTAALAALNHGGTNPWGPVGQALAKAAEINPRFARAIGMQDDTVIGRAITSPGMSKSHLQVHGFVVLPETTLDSAVLRVEQEVRRLPYLRTAVLIPQTNDYYPSHIISRDPPIAEKLAIAYPNAELRSGLHFEGGGEASESAPAALHEGPWILFTELAVPQRTIALPADSPWARSISPGDYVVLATRSNDTRSAHAVAIVNAVARDDSDLVFELHPVRSFVEPVALPTAPAGAIAEADGD